MHCGRQLHGAGRLLFWTPGWQPASSQPGLVGLQALVDGLDLGVILQRICRTKRVEKQAGGGGRKAGGWVHQHHSTHAACLQPAQRDAADAAAAGCQHKQPLTLALVPAHAGEAVAAKRHGAVVHVVAID